MHEQAPFGAFRPLAHPSRATIRAVIVLFLVLAGLLARVLVLLGVLVSPTARPSPLGLVNAVLDVILLGVFFWVGVGHNSITIAQGSENATTILNIFGGYAA
jgi:hypothetical protein